MVSQSLLNNTNVQVTSALGGMQVLEYVQDMSVSPSTSKLQYYMELLAVYMADTWRERFCSCPGISHGQCTSGKAGS